MESSQLKMQLVEAFYLKANPLCSTSTCKTAPLKPPKSASYWELNIQMSETMAGNSFKILQHTHFFAEYFTERWNDQRQYMSTTLHLLGHN